MQELTPLKTKAETTLARNYQVARSILKKLNFDPQRKGLPSDLQWLNYYKYRDATLSSQEGEVTLTYPHVRQEQQTHPLPSVFLFGSDRDAASYTRQSIYSLKLQEAVRTIDSSSGRYKRYAKERDEDTKKLIKAHGQELTEIDKLYYKRCREEKQRLTTAWARVKKLRQVLGEEGSS